MLGFSWSVFGVLMLASMAGIIASVPFTRRVYSEQLADLPVIRLAGVLALQYGVMAVIASALGLSLSRATGLGAPLLASLLAGDSLPAGTGSSLLVAAAGGAAVAVAILTLDVWYLGRHLPDELHRRGQDTTFLQRVLVSFFGGIVEEVIIRLGLMTVLAAMLGLVWSSGAGTPATGPIWVATILAALLFGVGHLPAAASITDLTPLVIGRTIVLNALAGMVFGLLYWQMGLLAAMLAHFTADIVLLNLGSWMVAQRTRSAAKAA